MKVEGSVRSVEIKGRKLAAPNDADSFLNLYRLNVVNTYKDGSKSPVYRWDSVFREWLDAVVLLLTARVNGKESICLRSSVRPPLLLRPEFTTPIPDEKCFHTLWELPAGIIEKGDKGEQGIKQRAAKETFEETGYRLSDEDFTLIHPALFVSPGVIPERFFYAQGRIRDVTKRTPPEGDGSIPEKGAGLWWVALDDALALSDQGEIVDMKTELGIRRLASARKTI